MSLINDALKRARDSQQKTPPPGATPFLPVEPRERGFNWILPALVVLLIAVACFFISLALAKRTVENTVAAPVVAAPAVAPDAVVSETPAPPPVATEPVESAVAAAPPAPANTDTVVSVAIAPIKVQGIVYDPVRPWAIVDDKTIYVGDRVRDFRVKQISKNSITLTGPGGTTEVLGLGE